MRALPWRDGFDAALIWYTTFGYFDEADNERVLMQAAAALKPRGRVLIEQINRAALLRDGLPRSFVTERGDDVMIDLVSYDLRTERTLTERITVRGGRQPSRCASMASPNSPSFSAQQVFGTSRDSAATASR
jgi:hypothetical protein